MTSGMITNICASDLQLSKRFYMRLLDAKVVNESDWQVRLNTRGNQALDLAVIARDHDLTPDELRVSACDIQMTFVVDDVDAAYNRAVSVGVKIVQAPRNEFCGQRRFLVRDPDGCVIDISSVGKSEKRRSRIMC